MLGQVEQEAAAEEHAKQVSLATGQLLDALLNGSRVAIFSLIKSDDQFDASFACPDLNLSDQFQQLDRLLVNDPVKAAQLQLIRKETTQLLEGFKKAAFFASQSERGLAGENLRLLQPLMNTLSDQLNKIRDEARQQENSAPIIKKRQRDQMKALLTAGLLTNLLLATALVTAFNKGATKRLSILMDNSVLLSQGKPLAQPLGGSDEIAELDAMFHKMAGELKRAHETEKVILESIPVGLVVTTYDGIISMANSTFKSQVAPSRESPIGESISTYFSVDDEHSGTVFLERLLVESSNYGYQLAAKDEAGTSFPMQVMASRLAASGNNMVLLVTLDIRVRQELEKALRAFIATVRNDLQKPLTSIESFVERANMNAKSLNQDGQRLAQVAQRNVTRLIKLVDELLNVESKDFQKFQLELAESPLAPDMEKALDSVRGYASIGSVILESFCERELVLTADHSRLVQVLVNLLGNAIKFSPPGAVVTISAQESGDFLLIKVQDQGRGIPSELKDSIFGKFEQVELRDATEKKGSGLGLASSP